MHEVDVHLLAFHQRPSQTLNLDDYDLIVVLAPRDEAQQPLLKTATEVIQWTFADPADTAGNENEQLRAFRRVRDELRTRVALFVNSTRRGDVPPPVAP